MTKGLSARTGVSRFSRIAPSAPTVLALSVCFGWAAGCDITGPSPTTPTRAMVSDPADARSPALQGAAGLMAPPALAPDDEAVYVSLPPGSVREGSDIEVSNEATAWSVRVPTVDGGLDPVAVPATAGDALAFAAYDRAIQLTAWVDSVRVRVPPKVVRTYPARGKRDVPLSLSMLVVFSEPIDSTTLDEGSVYLTAGGFRLVDARLELSGADGLAATLIPTRPLAPGTRYRLVVTERIRDLDRDALETPVTVEFTTVGTEAVGVSQIAFVSSGIQVMNADGSGMRRLTAQPDDWGPAWSADGLRLAFSRNSGVQSNDDIYVMNRDGSGVVRLTRDGHNQQSTWSPDGTKIAFNRDGEIAVMNADGSQLTSLTARLSAGVSASGPAWSPDGSRITFASDRDKDPINYSNYDIYVMNADGSGVQRLTNHPAVDYEPAWSPDGSRIAFRSNRDWDPEYGPGNIYLMNADGSGVVRLTSDPVHDSGPTWSPDGARIAFSSERAPDGYYSNQQIYVVDVAGFGLARLTNLPSPAWAEGPAWSPVGGMPPAPSLSLQEIDGDGQVDTVRATLGQPLRVRILQDGTPVPGIAVAWRLNDRLGSISPSSTTTDADGVASATWSLGPNAGLRTATAYASVGAQALAATFTSTGTPGKAAFLRYGVNFPPLAVAGSTLPVGGMVFDRHSDALTGYGNPLAGIAVDFAVTVGAGAMTPSRDTTELGPPPCGSWPCALASFTLGPDEGVNTAAATVPDVPGHPPVIFTTTAVAAVVDGGGSSNEESNVFTPANVTVLAGRTVGWLLGDPDSSWEHNVTFEDEPTQPTSSPNLSGGATHLRTFQGSPRVVRYRCMIHSTSYSEGMVGTVTVQ